jgi:GGDEF domain-containing protein
VAAAWNDVPATGGLSECAALVRSAEALRTSAPELSVQLARRALLVGATDISASNTSAGEARTLSMRAQAVLASGLVRTSQHVGAVEPGFAALALAESGGALVLAAELRLDLAACAQEIGEPLLGGALLRPVLEATQAPPSVRAAALGRLVGCVAHVARRDDVEDALAEADRLLAADDGLSPDIRRMERARLAVRSAAYHRWYGDNEDAVTAARDGLTLLGRLRRELRAESDRLHSRLVLELVCALLDEGELNEAEDVAHPTVDEPVRATSAESVGQLMLAMATRVHLPAGEVDRGRVLLDQAAWLAERHGLDSVLADALTEVSRLDEQAGRTKEALEAMRAARAAEQRRMRAMARAARHLLVQVSAARDVTQQAASLLRQLAHPSGVPVAIAPAVQQRSTLPPQRTSPEPRVPVMTGELTGQVDESTGLLNREGLVRRLRAVPAGERPVALTLVRFEPADDNPSQDRGPDTGIMVGLADKVRDMAPENAELARSDGGELAVLMPHTTRDQAEEFAATIRETATRPGWASDSSGKDMSISTSVVQSDPAATDTDPHVDATKMLTAARDALTPAQTATTPEPPHKPRRYRRSTVDDPLDASTYDALSSTTLDSLSFPAGTPRTASTRESLGSMTGTSRSASNHDSLGPTPGDSLGGAARESLDAATGDPLSAASREWLGSRASRRAEIADSLESGVSSSLGVPARKSLDAASRESLGGRASRRAAAEGSAESGAGGSLSANSRESLGAAGEGSARDSLGAAVGESAGGASPERLGGRASRRAAAEESVEPGAASSLGTTGEDSVSALSREALGSRASRRAAAASGSAAGRSLIGPAGDSVSATAGDSLNGAAGDSVGSTADSLIGVARESLESTAGDSLGGVARESLGGGVAGDSAGAAGEGSLGSRASRRAAAEEEAGESVDVAPLGSRASRRAAADEGSAGRSLIGAAGDALASAIGSSLGARGSAGSAGKGAAAGESLGSRALRRAAAEGAANGTSAGTATPDWLADTKAALSSLEQLSSGESAESAQPSSALADEDSPTKPLHLADDSGTGGRSVLNSLGITNGSGGRRRADGDPAPETPAEGTGWPAEPDVSQVLHRKPSEAERASSYEETRAELARMMSSLNAKALRSRSRKDDTPDQAEAVKLFNIAELQDALATIPTPPEPDPIPEPPPAPDIPEPPQRPDTEPEPEAPPPPVGERSRLLAAFDALTGPVLSSGDDEPVFRTEFESAAELPARKPRKSWSELESSSVVESPAEELFGTPVEEAPPRHRASVGEAFGASEPPAPTDPGDRFATSAELRAALWAPAPEAPAEPQAPTEPQTPAEPQPPVETQKKASAQNALSAWVAAHPANEGSATVGERSANGQRQHTDSGESSTDSPAEPSTSDRTPPTAPSGDGWPPSGASAAPVYDEPIGPQPRPHGLPRRGERSATTIASLLTEALAAYQSTTDDQHESARTPDRFDSLVGDPAVDSGRHRSPE